MKARLIAAIFVSFLAPLAFAQVGGTVKLDGKPPEMKVIDMSGVPDCGKQHDKPVHEKIVVVGADGGLANVVVSIKKAEGQALPGDDSPPKAPAVLDQKGCEYEPHVLAVQVGQPIIAKNADKCTHNVHTMPVTNDPDNVSEIGIDAGKKLKTPTAAEYYPVACNYHPWMHGWIAAIDSKFFAVTDKDGKYKLPNGLPDGKYTLHAWHEKYGDQDQNITVKDGKATGNFTFK